MVIDRTGEFRSISELEEALKVVKQTLVDPPMDRPLLVVSLPTIRECLEVLIALRKQERR